MTVLVADISNGRTKLALAREGRIVSEVHVCPTSEVTATRLALLCVGWSYEKAAFSSVVPAAEQAFRAFASRCKAVEQVRPSSRLAVSFSSYPGVSTLGGDRVANAVAAALRYPGDAVVVIDAGTATTVDVVLPAETDGGKPLFLGGAIAPGVRTMVLFAQRYGTAAGSAVGASGARCGAGDGGGSSKRLRARLSRFDPRADCGDGAGVQLPLAPGVDRRRCCFAGGTDAGTRRTGFSAHFARYCRLRREMKNVKLFQKRFSL